MSGGRPTNTNLNDGSTNPFLARLRAGAQEDEISTKDPNLLISQTSEDDLSDPYRLSPEMGTENEIKRHNPEARPIADTVPKTAFVVRHKKDNEPSAGTFHSNVQETNPETSAETVLKGRFADVNSDPDFSLNDEAIHGTPSGLKSKLSRVGGELKPKTQLDERTKRLLKIAEAALASGLDLDEEGNLVGDIPLTPEEILDQRRKEREPLLARLHEVRARFVEKEKQIKNNNLTISDFGALKNLLFIIEGMLSDAELENFQDQEKTIQDGLDNVEKGIDYLEKQIEEGLKKSTRILERQESRTKYAELTGSYTAFQRGPFYKDLNDAQKQQLSAEFYELDWLKTSPGEHIDLSVDDINQKLEALEKLLTESEEVITKIAEQNEDKLRIEENIRRQGTLLLGTFVHLKEDVERVKATLTENIPLVAVLDVLADEIEDLDRKILDKPTTGDLEDLQKKVGEYKDKVKEFNLEVEKLEKASAVENFGTWSDLSRILRYIPGKNSKDPRQKPTSGRWVITIEDREVAPKDQSAWSGVDTDFKRIWKRYEDLFSGAKATDKATRFKDIIQDKNLILRAVLDQDATLALTLIKTIAPKIDEAFVTWEKEQNQLAEAKESIAKQEAETKAKIEQQEVLTKKLDLLLKAFDELENGYRDFSTAPNKSTLEFEHINRLLKSLRTKREELEAEKGKDIKERDLKEEVLLKFFQDISSCREEVARILSKSETLRPSLVGKVGKRLLRKGGGSIEITEDTLASLASGIPAEGMQDNPLSPEGFFDELDRISEIHETDIRDVQFDTLRESLENNLDNEENYATQNLANESDLHKAQIRIRFKEACEQELYGKTMFYDTKNRNFDSSIFEETKNARNEFLSMYATKFLTNLLVEETKDIVEHVFAKHRLILKLSYIELAKKKLTKIDELEKIANKESKEAQEVQASIDTTTGLLTLIVSELNLLNLNDKKRKDSVYKEFNKKTESEAPQTYSPANDPSVKRPKKSGPVFGRLFNSDPKETEFARKEMAQAIPHAVDNLKAYNDYAQGRGDGKDIALPIRKDQEAGINVEVVLPKIDQEKKRNSVQKLIDTLIDKARSRGNTAKNILRALFVSGAIAVGSAGASTEPSYGNAPRAVAEAPKNLGDLAGTWRNLVEDEYKPLLNDLTGPSKLPYVQLMEKCLPLTRGNNHEGRMGTISLLKPYDLLNSPNPIAGINDEERKELCKLVEGEEKIYNWAQTGIDITKAYAFTPQTLERQKTIRMRYDDLLKILAQVEDLEHKRKIASRT